MPQNSDLATCRVCGLIQTDLPWGKTGRDPSHDICDCCGVEFGYGDFTIKAIQRSRNIWIQSGTKWRRPKAKPEGWVLEEQLRNIPDQFR